MRTFQYDFCSMGEEGKYKKKEGRDEEAAFAYRTFVRYRRNAPVLVVLINEVYCDMIKFSFLLRQLLLRR